jgi:hypothetical protein
VRYGSVSNLVGEKINDRDSRIMFHLAFAEIVQVWLLLPAMLERSFTSVTALTGPL